MAPSCFALQVPDVQGCAGPGEKRLQTALVSLERSRFHACPCDWIYLFFVWSKPVRHGWTGRSGSYGPVEALLGSFVYTTNGVYTVGSYDNIVCLVRHLLAYLVLCILSDQNTVQCHSNVEWFVPA